MKKWVLFIVFGCIMFACASVKIEVNKSTAQQWSGGAAQQRGYNYHIQFSASKDLHLDSVYIDDYCFELKETRQASAGYFWYKEEEMYHILIRHVHYQGRKIPDRPEAEEVICPKVNKKGAAQIIYHLDGKRGVFDIADFEKIQGIAYP